MFALKERVIPRSDANLFLARNYSLIGIDRKKLPNIIELIDLKLL
jgi:hypothetical protein